MTTDSIVGAYRRRAETRPIPATLGDYPGRPLWSVLIPVRNCGDYLRIALESVVNQSVPEDEMEIVVMDDCSDSESSVLEIVRAWGDRVRLIRHDRNVGKCANYQSGISAARGKLIHILHGDDFVLDGFYESMAACFEKFPEAGAFFCESRYVNSSGDVTGRTGSQLNSTGIIADFCSLLYLRQRIQTPSIVVRRKVYESIGGFDHRLTAFEDWEMWFRISLTYPVGFNAGCLAAYRISEGNTSTQSILTGRRTGLLLKTLEIMDEDCPAPLREQLRKSRNHEVADYLMNCLKVTVKHRAVGPWLRIVATALRFDFSARRFAKLMSRTVRLIVQR